MIDTDGILIAYDLFKGNTNACLTTMPVMRVSSICKRVGRTIVIADKGLDTSDNIAACILGGNGYAFSKSYARRVRLLKIGLRHSRRFQGENQTRR